jgi:hypothetical protein
MRDQSTDRDAAVGRMPPFAVGHIVAIARVNDLTLITASGADYMHLAGMRIVDWSR